METDKPKILIVDDEINICQNCVKILEKIECEVHYSLNGYDALKKIEQIPFDVVITDLKMSSLGGMEILRRVKDDYPETKVIVITGYSTISSAVEVMKMGAFDYLPKPFTPHELRAITKQAIIERDIELLNRDLEGQSRQSTSLSHQLIGNSPKIQKVISMIQKVAPTDSTVLVYGESGTGKELVARAVHANSNRQDKVFFAVDCGTLSDNLLESKLFGYTKGAFTGAYKDKDGILKMADGGTVFLDEISNTSLEVQAKLLRFIETREFIPVGSNQARKINIRLIFATNKNLKEMVSAGSFREDFYYRIYVYPIILPRLRDRKMDILPISYYFLKQFSQNMGKKISAFDERAASALVEYDWPGNIRQLKNIIERAVILCEKGKISFKELPLSHEPGEIETLIEYVPSNNEELKQIKKEVRQKAVNRIEKNFLLHALAQNNWNVTHASKKTGMQRSNFQNLIKKHGIKLQHKPPQE